MLFHVQSAIMRYLPLFEPLHVLNNVKLLPAFREVDRAIWEQVSVSDVDKRKVLQHQASVTYIHTYASA